MADGKGEETPATIIKKYANRRLYDTGASRYVTLDDLCAMVKNGVEFVVHDAKTGNDITRAVLTQIIFEQETRGENLLPIGFLRQLIGYYDDGLRAVVPSYLEVAMDSFAENQKYIRRNMETAFGGVFPLRRMHELGERNMAAFRNALGTFGPFSDGAAEPGAKAEAGPAAPPSGNGAAPPAPGGGADRPAAASEIDEMRAQLARMQARLDALSRDG